MRARALAPVSERRFIRSRSIVGRDRDRFTTSASGWPGEPRRLVRTASTRHAPVADSVGRWRCAPEAREYDVWRRVRYRIAPSARASLLAVLVAAVVLALAGTTVGYAALTATR